MKKIKRKRPPETEVVLLRDLAPRSEVKGGAGKILFGERLDEGGDAVSGRERATDGRPKRHS